MTGIDDIVIALLEKHTIPTIASVVAAIIVLLFTPIDSWILNKLGNNLFLIMVAGVAFIVLQFAIFIYKRLNDKDA